MERIIKPIIIVAKSEWKLHIMIDMISQEGKYKEKKGIQKDHGGFLEKKHTIQ